MNIKVKNGRVRVYDSGRELAPSEAQRYMRRYNEPEPVTHLSLFKELFQDYARRYASRRIYSISVNPQQN